ncbi:exported hypothetical protein [Microcystis aeruginosa PCC 9809]|jgi:hypothetical protein|nr:MULTISPECIES: hypothetical protein [Microcystis]MCE2673210.1 hypothetical protein [Microcystis sp. 53598_E5]MDJ0523910.1 hypothetical protein [Microcystis sp. M53600_WE12]NCQ98623.1 hypothetical protein [Microcystis aeruginosa L211-11]NCR30121.1 hypothetical protein [Microcystis aeruginosa L211-101]REJ49557.1 MAG: hypothetical protein DWQ53_02150 [Microcystis flos-aquae DF17]
MFKQKIVALVGCFSLFWLSPALADSCQKSVVISRDGYANIRSSPQVKKHNIIGTLPIGMSFEQISLRYGWVNIRTPVSGWIKESQTSRMSCDAATKLLLENGLSAISRFGKQAITGNLTAAEIFLRMAQGLDGVVAETYLISLTDFVSQNPAFFVSVLQQQSLVIRQAVLDELNTGLGTKKSPERLKFENFLKKLPENHIIVQEWRQFNHD